MQAYRSRSRSRSEEDPDQTESTTLTAADLQDRLDGSSETREPAIAESPQASPARQAGVDSGDGLGVIELPDLGFNLEKMTMPRKKILPPVELVESIFRAYDIRGIVGETLDADVAYQVGQMVGALTLERKPRPWSSPEMAGSPAWTSSTV